MMPSIANVNSYFAKISIKNRMSGLPLHVVSGFIEVTHSWNMTFFLSTQNGSVIINNHSSIVASPFFWFPLKDRGNKDDVMFFSQLLEHLS